MVSVSNVKVRRREGTKAASGNTGIPGAVQAKFEAASGLSFEDVRVHYNSSRPAQLGAYAYTQGSQVYIGPGQERHLEHELGHVVQQKRGLVKANGYINGVPVNRDPGLERAADLGADQPVQGFWKGLPGCVVQMAPPGEEEEEGAEERAEAAEGPRERGGRVLDNANYAQTTYSNTFSAEERRKYTELAGRSINTINDLVSAINDGTVSVASLPVEYIERDGNILILNTRTSHALTQAGIPRNQWTAVKRTGYAAYEKRLDGQLRRNHLTAARTPNARQTGGH